MYDRPRTASHERRREGFGYARPESTKQERTRHWQPATARRQLQSHQVTLVTPSPSPREDLPKGKTRGTVRSTVRREKAEPKQQRRLSVGELV